MVGLVFELSRTYDEKQEFGKQLWYFHPHIVHYYYLKKEIIFKVNLHSIKENFQVLIYLNILHLVGIRVPFILKSRLDTHIFNEDHSETLK